MNKRAMISMTEAELWAFIRSRKTIQVCSLNRDGTPHLVPMWFTLADGHIFLVSYTRSQKIVNLQRNPQIAVLLEDGTDYQQLRGVSINGKAELISDHEQVQGIEIELILRNQAGTDPEQARAMTAGMSHKKTAVRIVPDKIMSWDHSKLDGAY